MQKNKTKMDYKDFRLFNAFSEIIPMGVWISDASEKIVYINPFLQRILSYNSNKIELKEWLELVHSSEREKVRKHWQQAKALGGVEFNTECELSEEVTGLRHAQLITKTLINNEGETQGQLGVLVDVTEARVNQNMLIESAKLATLGEISASVAHEINNPMAIIMQNSEAIHKLLKTEIHNKNEQISKAVNQIIKTVNRVKRITLSLRHLSRNTQFDKPEKVNIQEVIDDALSLTEKKLFLLEIEMRLNIPQDLPFVLGNFVEISQVVLNLVINARDAVVELDEKWIDITCEHEGGFVVLKVTDSGKGIEKINKSRIFEPFFTTKELGKGTGLGLSISKNIISNLGGDLYFNDDSSNTQFIVKLPVFKKGEGNEHR